MLIKLALELGIPSDRVNYALGWRLTLLVCVPFLFKLLEI